MNRRLLLVVFSVSIIVASTSFALETAGLIKLKSLVSSDWEGTGEGSVTVANPPAPRITSVTFDKKSIAPGDWVTITVQATNDGDTAEWQTIHIGLPFNPPTSDITIVSTDLNLGAKAYPVGSEVWAGYGAYKITTKYTLVEGAHSSWTKDLVRTLTVKVKFPDTDTVAFDIKSVGGGTGVPTKYDPTSGMIDQQDEFVRTYLILRKFLVTVSPGGTAQEVSISITNHGRSTYQKTQPSMTVNSFTVTNNGGFTGTITATSLPSNITPGSTGTIRVSVSAPSSHPLGTYAIQYKVSGTP